MKIGNIDLGERPVMLAPMEDVTDPSFRLICREQGAKMVYTEFVSSEALVRNIASTARKLNIDERERPVAIQIYGRDPEAMVDAAKMVEDAGPDIIDINFGCPVKKVAGKGAGAGMLRDVPKMLAITESVVKAVSLPVTVKTRLGWDAESKIITDLAPSLQDCGIAALTVHGRTRGTDVYWDADWSLIGELKSSGKMEIPIIGNGDITTPQDNPDDFRRYVRRINRFGAFIVFPAMVGLAAIGESLFHTLFGSKWDASILLFQILVIRGIFVVLVSLYGIYMLAKGYGKRLFIIELIKDSAIALAIISTVFLRSVEWLVWGQLIASVVTFVIVVTMTGRAIGYRVGAMIYDLMPFASAACVMWCVCRMMSVLTLPALMQMMIEITVGAAAYLLIMWIGKSPELQEGSAYIFGRFRKRK